MTRGLFIAGTSTEVGKTYVAAMIAQACRAEGRRVGAYKPVASGCRRQGDQLVSDDALLLWEATGRSGALEQVCPQRFLAPIAPHRAAAAEGRRVDPELLRTGFDLWNAASEIVLVEGAGGLMSPLSDVDYNIDLAADLKLPLLIVAANQLGVINATLQTLITAEARAPQAPIVGVVLNQPAPREGDASLASNAAEIEARCPAPLLAKLAYGQREFNPRIDWFALASAAMNRD